MVSRLSSAVAKAGKGRVVTPKKKVGPISTLDMGKFGSLQGVDITQRKTHMNTLEKIGSFNQLKLSNELRSNIASKLLKSPQMPPTPVQKVAIKALQSSSAKKTSSAFLVAAETGSGKTLAYLAPLISRLQEEQQINSNQKSIGINSIVLVPTLELANQVGETIDKVKPADINYHVSAGSQHHVSSIIRHAVSGKGIDILVSTPDKVLKLMNQSGRLLEDCQMCVVDEADSLFNRSFAESTQSVLDKLPELQTAVFVSATIPRFFDKYLREKWPQIIRLVTPSIHRLPRHIEFRVIEAWRRPYNNKKELALQQALYAIYHDNTEPDMTKRVIVFVNRTRDVPGCVDMLTKAGFDAQALSRESNNLAQFVQSAQPRSNCGVMQVLVTTDVAARGVDFRHVRNVVLYDMPPSAADLLHRAGRTGRLGAKGRVLLIVNRQESQGWVRGLETIVKRGMALA